MDSLRLQSATEYLMTYGWAILIIAVVLGALYQLGLFGTSQNALAASCLSTAGFLCQNPTLNSSGYLGVKFGQIDYSSITVTNIACTQNTTSPVTTNSVNLQLSSGATAIVAFSCPLTSNSLGSSFKGYLWITYNTQLQTGVVDRFAVVSAKVATSGNVIAILGGGPSAGGAASSYTHYVPITLTNSQSIGTGAGFQQMITINSNAYSAYINPTWNNVEFTTGAGAAGTVIPAWVEANPSNTATNTLVWLKLPNSIAAGGNTIIYVNFMVSNVMSNTGPTGEAPQLSGAYAQYDNGASIFGSYWNFAGTSLPSGWSTYGGGSPTVSNALTLSSISAWGGISYQLSTNGNVISDMYASEQTTQAFGSVFSQTGVAGGSNHPDNSYEIYMTGAGTGIVRTDGTGSPTNLATGSYSLSLGPYYVVTQEFGTGIANNLKLNVNYVNALQATDSTYTSSSYYIIMVYTGGIWKVQYARIRSMPPNDIMPSVSFGAIV